ncbi:undecaprenyldiphospho-muramoylpentapeptide beta-N-acetylglucosaminyltransferase [Vagococcus coleopterorum]|uniref:UDP-N-acetylglucosamine--N-acetylmuramyl-(pentapeptide) pyrophosphoryl-undecaprenol N-acetylglucosamine transferase n=1 Tax=Vagococcus coleopterorum TaxID=2714946 RepID=A0A6G8APE9_9ENTE|nr:undecaprenyldiphospho-muramoylpentapeptide beta-N-acetylglucosaminyltransferase [Vagococcus coleopterorum]QIL46954.1 undecaprenyldiphospho-muramoylpentapeptide beta-N-acetylglucosaminyltransferase [Vagococcus coleopterorum]
MRVLVSGGGTGGHIYPAVSLVKAIKERHPEAEFLFVGTERGLESKIVPNAGIPFETIEIQGFRRSLSKENFKTVYLFMKSVRESKKIVKEFKPDVVVGTGGYVSAAVVYAASKLGVPTAIHEQNSVPGITNKFLSKRVDKIGLCFKDAAEFFPKDKIEMTGNPRGQEVVAIGESDILSSFGFTTDKKTVLIFGGSQGAWAINQAIESALSQFNERDYQVLIATGERYYESMVKKAEELNIDASRVALRPYLENMPEILNNLDLVVCRAGATSIAEITALGLPSILIPSPNVTNDHQTKNAMSLVNNNAASLLTDADLTGNNLVEAIDELVLDSEKLAKMAQASKAEGIPDAGDRLAEMVLSLIK